ncbi:MAG TPA: alpha-amylase family glycosyl hydrolase [Treponemataceae bacterium]|nr:alpha-amylase family glycosyl hydrolase [Treponemataceae bacterium]
MKRFYFFSVLLVIASVSCSSAKISNQNEAYLHVPSPDWSEQIIYFVLTDRFYDGNTKNSNQKKGEYDPSTIAKYSGGDLSGVTQKIDYIQGLGASAVWITPPVANQWWDPMVNYGGYHGYWAENLVKVDKHMGTLEEYKELSACLHKNNMYLIQDIVPNHMGNFFRISGSGDEIEFELNKKSVPVSAPTQVPFNKINWNKKSDREAAIYHWTGSISNFDDDTNRYTHQLSDLDDLNTENPVVIEALKKSYGYWIKEVGVDAFRVDTVKYVPHEFWNEFFHGSGGIMQTAQLTGRNNFTAFGEAWYGSTAFDDTGDKQAASYVDQVGYPMLPALLNFSLQTDMVEVFARGKSTDRLDYRLTSLKKHFGDLRTLYNFLDNHDMDRFLVSANVEDLETALLFMYTIPGIPIIYYGTEQEFEGVRDSMFSKGYGSGGIDHFNTESRIYTYLADLASLRRSCKAFTQGDVEVFATTNQGAGILAYKSIHADTIRLTLLNTSENTILAANLDTELKNAILHPVFAVRERKQSVSTDDNGFVSLLLSPKSALVYEVAREKSVGENILTGTIHGPTGIWKNPRTLSGSTAGLLDARVVVDGNWELGVPVSGGFNTTISVDSLSAGQHSAVVAGFDTSGRLLVSEPYVFNVELTYDLVASVTDPIGDDTGPNGNYTYPKDETFNDKQCDITNVDVLTAGSHLNLVLTMNSPISSSWGPPNGFDHVAFYIYFSLPDSTSTETAMPKQNATLPDSMTWDYFSQIGGWMNFFYNSIGAGADSYGTAMVAGPDITVDRENQTLTFAYSSESFNNPITLSGMKIYIATYDYDGMSAGNRLIEETAGEWSFGGGSYKTSPLIMDDIEVVQIP